MMRVIDVESDTSFSNAILHLVGLFRMVPHWSLRGQRRLTAEKVSKPDQSNPGNVKIALFR